MKLKIRNILLCFIVIILSINCKDNKPESIKDNWKTFSENELEYSIEHPSNWDVFANKDFFVTGQNRGYSTKAFAMLSAVLTDTLRMDSLFQEIVSPSKLSFTSVPIKINGINGFRYTNLKSDEYIDYKECVILKTDEKWYKLTLHDSLLKDKFERFVRSFRIISK
ncbi:MAG: hypothetical protein ACPG6V_13425 [Flavobacteriales bacterium]